MILDIGVAVHILMSNAKAKDPFFTKAAIAIFISFGFYIPVILWVQKIPMLGMLMIPKTIAYIVLAVLVYRRYYRNY